MTRRTLTALALAGTAALAAPALAQQVTLYGLVDAAGVRAREPGGDWQWRLDGGGMSRSYIGFRGVEDLGGGLRLVFRLESYLRPDTGQSGRYSGDGFFSREANIGFSGQFGTTVIGRVVSPLYRATTQFSPFGDSPLFSPAVRQYYGARGVMATDRTWNNGMLYQNNTRDAPLRVTLAANLPENSSEGGTAGRNFGASLAYVTGPFAVSGVIERVKNSNAEDVPPGLHRQLVVQGNASYDLGAVRFFAQAGHVRTTADATTRSTLWQLGAAVPFGSSLVGIGYGSRRTTGDSSADADGDIRQTQRIASLTYSYFFSKNTDAYVGASYEKVTDLAPAGALVAGGIRHRF